MARWHPWHDLELGRDAPTLLPVYVEIPKESRVKYEIDKEGGYLRVDRILLAAVRYPANYGFIPRTLGEDGDALDALVLAREAVAPSVVIWGRPIGAVRMIDRDRRDDKIIVAPAHDPAFSSYRSVSELPAYMLQEIRRFFEDYKVLEGGKVKLGSSIGPEKARTIVVAAMRRYAQNL